ncbi:uncharacterized protein L969DRAFT_88384 [Mixia osmundae IAM 14324]|uniref:VASt domain-containing protein n=1 Tax=Mixia osmundae (strain CBS 9802 / IAM 14324 / JCM 22182 / KY 12970) TaxID=764103 RepID=G7E715_MIXOS|nr:uncharacterized protein L969DRAFT_88384 [Mixia osmundae IAM 14324]KEI38993.1 hypothetical protein L969DRAFT_88384 [Mixia osmundae IAM 14324]GAA98625.1 hypothetical protein E5Q_05312 [Mixia osmundae IAM 14324]
MVGLLSRIKGLADNAGDANPGRSSSETPSSSANTSPAKMRTPDKAIRNEPVHGDHAHLEPENSVDYAAPRKSMTMPTIATAGHQIPTIDIASPQSEMAPQFSSLSRDRSNTMPSEQIGRKPSINSTLSASHNDATRRQSISSRVTPADISHNEKHPALTAILSPGAEGPSEQGSLTLDHLLDVQPTNATGPLGSQPEMIIQAQQRRASGQTGLSGSPLTQSMSRRASAFSELDLNASGKDAVSLAQSQSDSALNSRGGSPPNDAHPPNGLGALAAVNTVGGTNQLAVSSSSRLGIASDSPSRRGSISAPKSPMLSGKKGNKQIGGIGSALAMSGATLASPAPALTQPIRVGRMSGDDYANSDRASYYGDADGDDSSSHYGAGYAVASSKRNADFHVLFKTIPEDDYLIEDYGCALQRDILIQGRLYISEHHLCFNANIFGWVTTLVVPFTEVVTIEKRMTAFVIPNAVQVATLHAKHIFASFLSRDTTYDLVTNIWRISHPDVPQVALRGNGAHENDHDSSDEGPEEGEGLERSSTEGARKRIARRLRGRSRGAKDQDSPTKPKDGIEVAAQSNGTAETARPVKGKKETHPVTECDCLTKKEHFANVVLDQVYPTSPEKLHNLVYTSAFFKDFATNNQKLTDIQMSDWKPSTEGTGLLERSMTYIKPLSGPVGPKSTKCHLTDANIHIDYDAYLTTLTTTKTPDVPSGGSFAVKTKTCIMWAKNDSARMVVTTEVEWFKSSFLKSVITSSALEGQKTLYKEMDKEMRTYIQQHRTEFGSVTADPGEEDEEPAMPAPITETKASETPDEQPQTTLFGFDLGPLSQYVSPVSDFLSSASESIADLTGQASPTAIILSLVIFVLLVSNIKSLMTSRHPERPRSLRTGSADDHAHQVADAVKDVLHEYFAFTKQHPEAIPSASTTNLPATLSGATEINEITQAIAALEARLAKLKQSIDQVD